MITALQPTPARTTPDGTSILDACPAVAYAVGDKRMGFKPGETVAASTAESGRLITLTIHSTKKAREWWAKDADGRWWVLRSARPISVAQMRAMNGPDRIYRRDKMGRFCR